MFKSANHIAIYTTDRDEAVKFYRDILGMDCKFELVSESDGIRIAMMELGDMQIELLEDPATLAGTVSGARSTQNHFAMEVDDIEEAYAYLKNKGVEMEERGIYSVPQFGPDNIKVAFFHGPNGERIEILQYVR
ncbi:MAG: VOC family protein [Eubacterium sp.]|nr:VOC family protein [Eubacterium sp.]